MKVVPAGRDPGSAGHHFQSLIAWDHQDRLQKDVVWAVMAVVDAFAHHVLFLDIEDEEWGRQLTKVDMGTLFGTSPPSRHVVAQQTNGKVRGLEVVDVERFAVLVAPMVVAGLVVPAAQLAERSQQECWAHVAGVHPHHRTIHLPEECCPHVGVCHPGACGQDF